MKTYRIQARHRESYIDHRLQADNDQDALNKFSKLVSEGQVKIKDEAFYLGDRVYITFEEVDSDVTTGVGIEEVTAGIEVGQLSVITG